MQYFRATKQRRNINYSSCNEEDIVEVENFFWFILFIFYFLYSFLVRLNLSLWNISFNSMKVSWRFLSHVYKSLSCSDNITRIYCFEFVFSCLFFEENLYRYHLHKRKNNCLKRETEIRRLYNYEKFKVYF